MSKAMVTMWLCVVGMVLGAVEIGWGAPLGTATTYQGRLMDGDSPADGEYDFEFKLYDDPNVVFGNQVGSTISKYDEMLIGGVFTVELDFGMGVFIGDARWLEIEVAPAGTGSFTPLSPRQELKPTPYALQAETVSVPLELSGSVAWPGEPPGAVIKGTNTGDGWGVYGFSTGYGAGVVGSCYDGTGVYGISDDGTGVRGVSDTGRAVSGISDDGYGVYGSSSAFAGYFDGKGYFSGKVGIGKESPGDKLDVNGHINSSESYKLDGDTVLSNTGTDNIFAGEGAGASITTGYSNSAIGRTALYSNTSGYCNSSMGYRALYANTTGYDNTAMGNNALLLNYGNGNSALGSLALYYNTSGTSNSAVGYRALASNTTANDNSAMGSYALYSNTTGIYNSAMGRDALYTNTTGSGNTAMGCRALYSNTTVSDNTAMGNSALYYNTNGTKNSALGVCALFFNRSGNNNSALGYYALNGNTTGNYNIGVGYWANYFNQEGSNNTIIGYEAGMGTGYHNKSGNVFLGYQAGYNETGHNKLYIENSNSSSPLIYGEFDNDIVEINSCLGVGRSPATNDLEVEGTASKTTAGDWLANSDARIKTDIQTVNGALEKLDKVRLVSFKYTDDYRDEHSSVEDRRYLNVIAQEFREVFPDYVKSSGEKLPDDDEILQVDAYPLTIYSAAAVQELHDMAKAKDTEIAQLKERISKMEALLAKLINEQKGGRR